MKKILLLVFLLCNAGPVFCWGFYMHQEINYHAVFLLPPEMMIFYKKHIDFLREHAVDPDKRRYAVAAEAPRHYIDIDHYGKYPYPGLPRKWEEACQKFNEDSLQAHGIVPWWIQTMMGKLTAAFREKNALKILKLSAELGHYIADAHVPLHASSNHNGQLTGQRGIHAFWESRIPELMAEKEWDFVIGHARYISNPAAFIWARVLESAAAADTVLRVEKELSSGSHDDQKFSFESRNGLIIRQYSSTFCRNYNDRINHMVERRMRQSILAVASFWYSAWVNAGQPDLRQVSSFSITEAEIKEMEWLNQQWKLGQPKGYSCID
jgi:hypothetical protein